MNAYPTFIRTFFLLVSTIFSITFFLGISPSPTVLTYIWGTVLGLGVGAFLIALDVWFKRFKLRSFNTLFLGLFFGYLMGMALLLLFNTVLEVSKISDRHPIVLFSKIFFFLFAVYFGVTRAFRASEEFHICLPFFKFTPQAQRVKDILLDQSILNDPRIIDLAATGLLDKRVILPRFLVNELQNQEEFEEDSVRLKAKKGLEIIKKLESMEELGLRYQDTDFPDVKDPTNKILHLAKLLDADILSAEISRVQMAQGENVRILNMHGLSHALKPLMQRGELLKIKIQRQGKEERQGVGYLEDGTMVVVNGGGEFIGNTVQAGVLSVKHTSTGRIIFCNVDESLILKKYGEENI